MNQILINRMYNALRTIAREYATSEQLKKGNGSYGLDSTEALEMAYDNIQSEAKAAIKGITRRNIEFKNSKAKPAHPNTSPTFEQKGSEWIKWANENFPKSTAQSCMIHLQKEVVELLDELNYRPQASPRKSGLTIMEFADCFLCIITAAGKEGFTIEDLFSAIAHKMKINYGREWVENPDGTYSHVK